MPKFRKLGGTLKSLCISKNNYSRNIDDDAFLGMSSLKRLDIAERRKLELDIQNANMEYLSAGILSHMLPTSLVHLTYLYLEVYINVPDEVSSTLCLMRISPNLKRIVLKVIDDIKYSDYDDFCETVNGVINQRLEQADFSTFNFNHLEDFTIPYFSNRPLECEIIKLIMAMSPMLKTACIELGEDVSLREELKILRERICMPFLHASPSAITIMGRSEPSSIDDEVVQEERQRDDNDLQDERQDQPKEEEVEPKSCKRARTEKSFRPNFVSLW
ncbi:F-box/FBD/LRR-repeat protein-like protein [Tanacetum coccineum]